jgi:hypothetical protein
LLNRPNSAGRLQRLLARDGLALRFSIEEGQPIALLFFHR